MKKLAKFILILLALIAALIVLIFFFAAPIARYEIEKNSVRWTGRKITLGKVKINLLSGNLDLQNIRICEAGSDSLFFGCSEISLCLSPQKLLHKVYDLSKVSIVAPVVHIEQNGNRFNFDDLVKRFSSPAKDTAKKSQTRYYVSNVSISNGTIVYTNKPLHNISRIYDLNLSIPQFNWDKPESKIHIDMKSAAGGAFNINLALNRQSLNYTLLLAIDTFDLSQYYTPLRTLMDVSSIHGLLTARLRIHGNFGDPGAITFHGFTNINALELKDAGNRTFFAMHQLAVDVDSIDMRHKHFDVNHLVFYNPFVALDNFGKENNYSRMIRERQPIKSPGKDTGKSSKAKLDYSNIFTLLASSVKAMTIDFLHTNYHADSIAVHNGVFTYNDLTPEHKFRYDVSRINLVTSELNDFNEGVICHASARLGDSGKLILRASINYNRKLNKLVYNVDTLKFTDISPVANYMLQKNSVKWTGRRITAGKVFVNAKKGSIYIKDITIYEKDSITRFFACHAVYLHVDLLNLFNNVYHVEKLKIDNPDISIVQNGRKFNYDDLLKYFASDSAKSTQDTAHAAPWHYIIDSVLINHANVTYNNVTHHNLLQINDLNFRLPNLSWNKPKSMAHLDFKYGAGGSVSLNMDLNRTTSIYNARLAIVGCDLSQYYAPLTAYLNVSSLNGKISANLRLHGKLNYPTHISASGSIWLDNLELKDTAKRKVFGLNRLDVNFDTLNVLHNIYHIKNINIRNPFLLIDYYSNGNNLSNLIINTRPSAPAQPNSSGEIQPDYSNIFALLSSTVKMMAANFFSSDYHTDSIILRGGTLLYNDWTLNRDFHYKVSDLNLSTEELSAAKKSIKFTASATLNETGKLTLQADISPDLNNMLFNYDITNFRLPDINPYMEYYLGTPFVEGRMNYQSTDSVVNRYLKSSNEIHLTGVEMGKKIKDNPIYHYPVRFAVSLLENDKGDINLNLPASGNLNDPDYKIGRIAGRLLTQLVLKTVQSPFKHLADIFKMKAEDLKDFQFDYLQNELTDKEKDKLDDVDKVLDRKKDFIVEITQVTDSDAERDELALAMAKKLYYRDTKQLVNDSTLSHRQKKKNQRNAARISNQDTLFEKYLNEKLHLNGTELIQVQDKCIMLLGDTMLNRKVHELMMQRNAEVYRYMIHNKKQPPERVKVTLSTDSLKIQNLSQPEFDINYKEGDK